MIYSLTSSYCLIYYVLYTCLTLTIVLYTCLTLTMLLYIILHGTKIHATCKSIFAYRVRSQLTLGIYPIENFSMSSACGKYQVYKVYLSSKTHYKIDSYFMSTGQLSSMDHIHKISNPSLSVQTTYSNVLL